MAILYKKSAACVAGNRCKKYRVCDECNRIRQSKLCDVTELAARFSNKARYSVIMPYDDGQDEHIIKKLKTSITRKLRRSVDGCFVSVESSPNDALHLNIITMSRDDVAPLVFDKSLKDMGLAGSVFSEEIAFTDVRRVTAYSLKRQSLPVKEQYSGNLYNITGSIRDMSSVLQSKAMFNYCPAVAITSMCNQLLSLGLVPPTDTLAKTNTLGKMMSSLVFLVAQLDKSKYCYHDQLGLINEVQFRKYYNRLIGNAKRELTNNAKRSSYSHSMAIDGDFSSRWTSQDKDNLRRSAADFYNGVI
ncbi:MAG: hypothetical protein FE834_07015 [Gammaproteobacteria bacterium]|nr:hypothetical protein [Gammaproteobacteria bacterium]